MLTLHCGWLEHGARAQQSLALNYPLASSLCQTTTLTAQLRGGIRCLDLRFSLIRDDKKGGKPLLWAYHGPVPQGREMGEVFQELYEWLGSEEGKRETVIVSIKQVRLLPSGRRLTVTAS